MRFPPCPTCQSTLTYTDEKLLICTECGHEWSASAPTENAEPVTVWKDAVGNVHCKVDGVGAMQLKSSVVKKA